MWRGLVVVIAALPGCGRHDFARVDASGGGTGVDATVGPCLPPAAGVDCASPVAYTCGGRCYLSCTNVSTRPAAAVACTAWGGALATVLDDDANNCAASRIRTTEAWIGAQQIGATVPTADWYWPGGEPLGYQKWVLGDPDDDDGIEDSHSDCLMIDAAASWRDRGCGDSYGFVCDRP